MQEEVTQRTIALCVEATKLSAGMLQQAMKKVLDEMQKGVTGHKTKLHHGKQTLRQLMKHNTGVSNIEITDRNIRAFSATAKKYGIDFALKKGYQRRDTPLPGVLQGPGCRRYHGSLSGVLRKEPGEREKALHPQGAGAGETAVQSPAPPAGEGQDQRPGCGIMTVDWKKKLLPNLPYLLFVYLFDKLCQAVRLAPGLDASEKFLHLSQGFTEAFSYAAPSLHTLDLLVGIAGAVIVRLAVYAKSKNTKKYRKGIEYGSARWGTAADIAPYVDPVPDWNIPLTQTEKLTMSSRPKNPKYARNKNILVIGGSGSGKTRFFVNPPSCRCTVPMWSPIPKAALSEWEPCCAGAPPSWTRTESPCGTPRKVDL